MKKFRLSLSLILAVVMWAPMATSIRAASTNIVISEFRVRGPSGGNDEFIELHNISNQPVAIGGWKIQGSNNAAGVSTRATITAGTIIPQGCFYLLTNSASGGYSGAVPGNQTYSVGVTDDGGIALVDAANTFIDQVGMSVGSAYKEGSILPSLGSSNLNRSYERLPGGVNGHKTDTDNNVSDFQLITPSNPQNASSTCINYGGLDQAPSVTTTSPANNATNVPKNSSVVINFSESVNASSTAFLFNCGSPVTFIQTAAPTSTFTLIPSANLPANVTCTVTVQADQIFDTDPNDPPDNMVGNYSFSFQTAAADAAPFVQSTSPAGGASTVLISSNIVLAFSEPVTAPANAFSVQCPDGTPVNVGVTGSGSASITLNPDADLPYSTTCEVSVTAALVLDNDADDPPDQMAADYSFSFTTEARPPATNVIINEIDADTPGDDREEFIELYDGGVGHTPLDGLVVVLYDGGVSGTPVNKVYARFDLDGYSTNANGYFVLGNPGVANVDLPFEPGQFGLLQNGADAVALYAASASDFPVGFPASGALPTAGLRDAIVYDTDDNDNNILLALLNGGQLQVNEAGANDSQHQSSSRCENGTGGPRNTDTYFSTAPTPGTANVCPQQGPPSTTVVISQFYGSGGNAGALWENDYVELYNLGAETVDLNGWSLQYAAATGKGWDFNLTPLGGPIGPGRRYLVKLAATIPSDGSPIPGEPLPIAPNVTGPINMSGSNGKIALVHSVLPLRGECPIANPTLVDLVGYGAANCGEGQTKAPGLAATKSNFRINDGATDTNDNAHDFFADSATPRRTEPVVELGPMIVTTDPSIDGEDVPRDPTIAITFSEPVEVALDQPFYDLTCTISGQHNDFTAVNNDRFLDVTPNVDLTPGETCTFTLFKAYVHDTDADDSQPNTDTLFADYAWSFTVASGTPPPFPSSVHVTFGNPTNATANPANYDNYFMEKAEYNLSYNRDLGRPNWVSWHLSSEWYGTLTRVDTFRADPRIPPVEPWYRVQGFDFSGSGFDRGHMVPNADRDKETSKPINQATYLMTNMIAQAPDNNQGPWAAFEGYLRTQADASNELFIVAGPEGVGGTGSNGGVTNTIAGGHVAVPAQTWKVVLVVPKGPGDPISRVSCASRTIAVVMPNIQGIRSTPWETYVTTIDAVEALTGYDFFANLPDDVETCVEAGTNGDNPPIVTCEQADGLWHDGNVTMACTASDPGGLLNASDASFTLSTSVADGSEDANASTNTRQVCDKTGHCATAIVKGNKIDRKAPAVSCGAADGAWHADNVSIACTASDGGSGVSAPDASFSLSTSVAPGTENAEAATGSVAVCDLLGHCTTAGPVGGNKIDRKNPTVVLTSPANGASYALNAVAAASFTCGDTGSGVATCVGSVANGGPIDTASTGSKTFSVTVTDVAGNSASASVSYMVTNGPAHKRTPSISITNMPSSGAVGGSFTPAFSYDGNGNVHLSTLTPAVCEVKADRIINFIGTGTCTIVPFASASGSVNPALGAAQSVTIAP